MNQSQFLAITCNSFEALEKSRVQGAIGFGFGFASHWLKNWRESFKPITKLSNRSHVITFDSHLKTALLSLLLLLLVVVVAVVVGVAVNIRELSYLLIRFYFVCSSFVSNCGNLIGNIIVSKLREGLTKVKFTFN